MGFAGRVSRPIRVPEVWVPGDDLQCPPVPAPQGVLQSPLKGVRRVHFQPLTPAPPAVIWIARNWARTQAMFCTITTYATPPGCPGPGYVQGSPVTSSHTSVLVAAA